MRVLMSICVLTVATLTSAAEHPLNVVGEGLLSKPFTLNGSPGKGMRYAGPVVYTNEKPPIIFFPPPPKDAKPGFGGFSIFGKNKSPKSIKYVPMPHHDLPVLIYTSDKMPPIHVVQPSNVEGPSPQQFGNFEGPPPHPQFGSPREAFRPPTGSLQSVYRGILPEANSPRIVSSSYEIPPTSYGAPMKAFGSQLGSVELSSSSSGSSAIETNSQQAESGSNVEFGSAQQPVSDQVQNNIRYIPNGSNNKKVMPPNILYSGQPPIHVFNEPDMFVQAPREVPFKTYADMPPKASFGPPKSSFGPPSGNSFIGSHSHHRHHYRTLPSPSSLGSPYSRPPIPSYFIPARENLIPSASSHVPATTAPCSHNNNPNVENNQPSASSSHGVVAQSLGKPSNSAFKPPQTMFSFGPFSIEYGPPDEPFMSYSEPTGSLTSIYGAMNDGRGAMNDGRETMNEGHGAMHNGPVASGSSASVNTVEHDGISTDNWLPGPGPIHENTEEQFKEEAWDAQMPPPLPSQQQLHLRAPSHPRGPPPSLMHNSVLLPSSGPHHGPRFVGSRLAHLLSAFKLKRSRPKYAIAPKSMHKPPIIIYYGKKPPVHVYQKPDGEHGNDAAASSTSSVTVTGIESSASDGRSNDNNGNSKEVVQSAQMGNVELTYDSSQTSEVRVAAPSASSNVPAVEEQKLAIIPARPVDIFSSAELQPSIYMARNSLNTILVSDMTDSGSGRIKTYIVRNSEDPSGAYQNDLIINNNNNNDRSIPIAQDRISGEISSDQIPNTSSVPAEQVEVVEEENDDDSNTSSSSNDMRPTIVLAIGSPKQENAAPAAVEELETQPSEPEVTRIQSPSSFQTSLTQAEKEAEVGTAVEVSSSS